MYKKLLLGSFSVLFCSTLLAFVLPGGTVFGSHSTTSTDSNTECSTTQAVCSENGYTYDSECLAQEEGVEYTMGACESSTSTEEDTSSCSETRQVCSTNDYTYESECLAQEEGVEYTMGACEETSTSTEDTSSCSETQKVCSVYEYTYDSECLAQEEGVEYTMGACESSTSTEEDTSSCSETRQVCSTNDYTYESECLAQEEGVEYTMGACEETSTEGPFCVIPQDTSIEMRLFDLRSGAEEHADSLATDNIDSSIEEGQCPEERTNDDEEVGLYCVNIPNQENIEAETRERAESYQTDYPDSEIIEGECEAQGPFCVYTESGNREFSIKTEAEAYAEENVGEVDQGECPDRSTEDISEGPYCVNPEEEGMNSREFDTRESAEEYSSELETDFIDHRIEDESCEASESEDEELRREAPSGLEFGINPQEVTARVGNPASYRVELFSDISKPVFLYAETKKGNVKVVPKSIRFTPEQKEKKVRVILPGDKRRSSGDVVNFSYNGGQLNQRVNVNVSSKLPGEVNNEVNERVAQAEGERPRESSQTDVTPERRGVAEADTSGECSVEKGQPYTHPETSAVWLITEDCTKRPFQSSRIYNTYFDSYSQVNSVSQSKLNKVLDDSAGFVPYGPKSKEMGLFKGGSLVKIPSDNRVYLLLGNKKYWITEEKIFDELNYQWDWIQDIAPSLLDRYESAGQINYTDHHPTGTLIKYPDSSKVYRVEEGAFGNLVKRHIKNEQVFDALGFRFDRVVTVDEGEEYETGKPINISDDIFSKQNSEQQSFPDDIY